MSKPCSSIVKARSYEVISFHIFPFFSNIVNLSAHIRKQLTQSLSLCYHVKAHIHGFIHGVAAS